MTDKKHSRLTGGPSGYYLLEILKPRRYTLKPYIMELQDLLAALLLSYSEANVVKAVWRLAKDRMGAGKGNDPKYELEKMVFFAVGTALEHGMTEQEILKAAGLDTSLTVGSKPPEYRGRCGKCGFFTCKCGERIG